MDQPVLPRPETVPGPSAIAIDAAWSSGQGPDVAGPIEALVITLAGRFAVLDQLHGDGMATLRMRADALRRQ